MVATDMSVESASPGMRGKWSTDYPYNCRRKQGQKYTYGQTERCTHTQGPTAVFRAGTGPALAPIWEPWVPMEASNAPFTVLTPCVIAAAQASSRAGVTLVCMPVADTWPAVRESPLAPLAAITAKPEGTSSAGALPAGPLAQATECPLWAALAGLTACGAKAVEARGTEITAAPHHRRFTKALAAVGIALRTQ